MSQKNREACKKYYQMHKEEKRKYNRKYADEVKGLINKIKGVHCEICGCDTFKDSRRIILHDRSGKKHPVFYWFYKSEYNRNHLEPYTRLCFRCHTMVHWLIHILKERTEEEQDKIMNFAYQANAS